MSVTKIILFIAALFLFQLSYSQEKKEHSAGKLKQLAQAAEYINDWQSAAEYYTMY